jgi:hypothetical protein
MLWKMSWIDVATTLKKFEKCYAYWQVSMFDIADATIHNTFHNILRTFGVA